MVWNNFLDRFAQNIFNFQSDMTNNKPMFTPTAIMTTFTSYSRQTDVCESRGTSALPYPKSIAPPRGWLRVSFHLSIHITNIDETRLTNLCKHFSCYGYPVVFFHPSKWQLRNLKETDFRKKDFVVRQAIKERVTRKEATMRKRLWGQ